MQGGSGGVESLNSLEWMSQLGARLNVDSFNRGIGGNKTSDMVQRWDNDITPLASRAKYVIIQGGVNDFGQGVDLATVQQNFNTMVSYALRDGLIPVVATCSPSTSITGSKETNRRLFNDWIRASFAKVIDIAESVQDPVDIGSLRQEVGWYGDGIHYDKDAKHAVALSAAEAAFWDFPAPSSYQPVVGTIPSTSANREKFDAWIRREFTRAQLAEASITRSSADPDGDSLNNLMEYALGLSPQRMSDVWTSALTHDNDSWCFSYMRPSDRDDIAYGVEFSTDLASWTLTTPHELVETTGDAQKWKSSAPLSVGTKVFFRIKITAL